MSEVKIEITTKTLFKTALFGFALFLGILLREVLVMLFVAFIINAGFRPLVDFLERRRIPRGLSIFLILVGVILLTALIVFIAAGEFITQFQTLIKALPAIFANVVDYLNTNVPVLNTLLPLDQIEQEIGVLSTELLNNQVVQNLLTGENILSVASSAFDIFGSAIGLVMSIFTVGMVSIYMLQRKDHVYEGIVTLYPII
jgi:predicted PurR-regulated permease PerM